MKKYLFLIFLSSFLFGFYGKVEPYRTFLIKSDVSGKVVEVNKSCEGGFCKGVVIQIDDYQNRLDLKNLENQLITMKKILESEKLIVERKRKNFQIFNKLKTKSQFEKDNKFFDYQNSLISLYQTKNSILKLETDIKKLKDTISKKRIVFKNYIYSLKVEKGDFVNVGTALAITMDINLTKIDIFIPIDNISTIKDKTIFINNKKSDFKISKIYQVADDKYVTSYKVEIIGHYPKISDVVKVEFK